MTYFLTSLFVNVRQVQGPIGCYALVPFDLLLGGAISPVAIGLGFYLKARAFLQQHD